MKTKIFSFVIIVALFIGGCGTPPTVMETTDMGGETEQNKVEDGNSAVPSQPNNNSFPPDDSGLDSSKSIPENMIIFALDESDSIPQNCAFSNARYDIPELFVPVFGQYYDENVIGSSSQTKYSPWVEVVHWPYSINKKNFYDLAPNLAQNIDYDSFAVSPQRNSGPFFDKVFNYLVDLPAFPNPTVKPTKRTLIFFTDGIFKKEPHGGEDSKDKTEKILSEMDEQNRVGSIKYDVHVVLMCPSAIERDDANWWTAKQSDYPKWFHLYDKQTGLSDLAVALWEYALKDKFPGEWNGQGKGMYLLSEDGYKDLNTEMKTKESYVSCRTPDAKLKCINFTFSPESTGFYASILYSNDLLRLNPDPYIWTDDAFQQLPVIRNGKRFVLWDSKVKAYDACTKNHSWTLNPGEINNDTLTLFWWRSASDLVFLINEDQNPIIYLGGSSLDTLPKDLILTVSADKDFIPLSYVSSCYTIALNVNGERFRRPLDVSDSDAQTRVSWDLVNLIKSLYPDILLQNPFTDKPLSIKAEIIDSKNRVVHEENIYQAGPAEQTKFIYVPSFLASEYKSCQAEGNFVGGGADVYQCFLMFEYIAMDYAFLGMVDEYRPSLYIANDQNERCSAEIKIDQDRKGNGYVINVEPQLSGSLQRQAFNIQISRSFFDNSPSCSNPNSARLYITWSNLPQSLGAVTSSWVCKFFENKCERGN